MKKFIILLVLLFGSLVNAINPVLVRDAWCVGRYKLYVPCDNDGTFWVMVDMGYPVGNAVNAPSFVILGMMYGRSREGKTLKAHGAAGWTETTGTWADSSSTGAEGGDGDFVFRKHTANAAAVGEFLVPAGHNEILLYIYDKDGFSDITIDWNDDSTTGLDITSYTSASDANGEVAVILVAANADPDGIKKLRITKDTTTKDLYVIGLQTWDTDKDALPSAANGSGVANGNGLVYRMIHADNTTTLPVLEPGGDSSVVQFGDQALAKSWEWAIKWAASGADPLKETGGGLHAQLNATYAPYDTIGAGTVGPKINIAGTAKNTVYGSVLSGVNGSQELLTGDNITLTTTGFLDYDNDGTQGGADPKATWIWSASGNQLTTSISISWVAATDIDASLCYSAMLPLDGVQAGDYFVVPPSPTKNDLTTGNVSAAGSQAYIHMQQLDGMIINMFTTSVGMEMARFDADDKLYSRVRVASLDGTTDPAAIDTLIIAGGWRFSKGYDAAMPSLQEGPLRRSRYRNNPVYTERSSD